MPEAVDLSALAAQCLAPSAQPMEPPWVLALDASFGSVAQWQVLAQAPGMAWQVLAWQQAGSHMVNLVLASQDPWPAGHVPLLAMAAQAVDQPVDWTGVYQRYQGAVHADSLPWGTGAERVPGAVLLDVRRAGVVAQASTQLPGARWRDPALVAQWAATLPAGRAVVVYCVYGHEVGRATALRLRAAGVDARYLHGGIAGWQAAGGPLVPREAA